MTTPSRPAWARTLQPSATGCVLAVDGTGLLVRCSRSASRAARLTAADGTPTGTLLFFVNSLARKMRVTRPGHVVVAWDGPGSRQWRQELFPGYKAGRAAPADSGNEQRLAMEFCGAASIRQLTVPGFEADDLLAAVQRHVAARMPSSGLVLSSDDADLLQLLGDEMTVVTGLTHDAPTSCADVTAAWMVPPWWLSCVRALSGDVSDGIPGLHGVGPARAVQMLSQGGWKWPLPEDALPGEGQRAQVGAWRDVMELVSPPRVPEESAPGGYFEVDGQAEWARPDNDAIRSFFGKYQLSSLSGKLSNGRLW